MSQSELFDVVVLGSGVAGLAAARRATAAGLSVCVVDKGRRIGGRVSTKRADGFIFNHGAQFLTARDPSFIEDCAAAVEAGALAEWQVAGRDAFCGAPTMRDFPAFLGADLDVRQSFEVTSITRGADAGPALHFTTADGTSVAGRRAVITAPAPQTANLLSEIAPELAASAAAAAYAPCWTAMYGFDETQVPSHAQPYRGDSGPVGWAVWEAHRPAGTGGALTVQAAPDWSAEHLEEEAQSVAEAMLSAYLVITGLAPGEPRYIAAHRWRYARVIRPAPADASMVSQQGDIAIAGDWVKGARVEDAFLSGRSAMDMLLASAT